MDTVYSDIGNFEQRLKNQGNFDEDSSDDNIPMSSEEVLQEKNRVLLERLYKSENQVWEMKSVIEMI